MPRHSLLGAAALFSFAGGAAPRVPFILVNYLVVGGGGFDGGGGHAYGGGGGGEVVATSATLSTYATYAASVAGPTGSSSFNNTVARGGGNASEGSHNHGGHGGWSGNGHGGGGGNGYGWDHASWAAAGGGGAGAGEHGHSAGIWTGTNPVTPQPGRGGNGIYWPFTGKYYGGGGGGWWHGRLAGDHNGASGLGRENFGGGSSRGNVRPGGVITTYLSPLQLFKGGAVTAAGIGDAKRWFHVFASSAHLSPLL